MGADPVLGALAAACPAARLAEPGDAIAGVMPRFAASPASVAEASALLAAAAAQDLAVVPRGGGSKLGWGAPPRRCDLVVDTTALDQVVEHAADDLVVRVQAGVSVARLGEVLAGAGQQLALDPPPTPLAVPGRDAGSPAGAGSGVGPGAGANPAAEAGPVAGANPAAGGAPPSGANGAAPEWLGATVGGTLATGAAGPRRLRYGTPRDLIIGITVVRADGTVAKSGGKVVKNVAGYDLGRLFTGSFGTLGLIVEAVFRLHPLPASTVYVTVDCPRPDEAYRAVAAAAGSDLAPSAVEIDRAAQGAPVRVAVLLEGDPDGTAERAGLLCSLLGDGAAVRPSAPAWWGWPATGNGWAGANGQPTDGNAAGDGGEPGDGNAAGDGGEPGGRNAPGDGSEPGRTGTLVRIAFWAAGLPRVLRVIDTAARAAGLDPAVGGSAAAGVIYAGTGPDADPAAVAAFVGGLRAALARGDADARPAAAPVPDSPPVLASAVVVHAPPVVRDLVDPWGPVPSLPLMRAVKDRFDPGHRMAPGRFAGGI